MSVLPGFENAGEFLRVGVGVWDVPESEGTEDKVG